MTEQFTHDALTIDSDRTLDRLLVPLLRAHVAAGQPVLMVVSPHTEWVLRDRLQGRPLRSGVRPQRFVGRAMEGAQSVLQVAAAVVFEAPAHSR